MSLGLLKLIESLVCHLSPCMSNTAQIKRIWVAALTHMHMHTATRNDFPEIQNPLKKQYLISRTWLVWLFSWLVTKLHIANTSRTTYYLLPILVKWVIPPPNQKQKKIEVTEILYQRIMIYKLVQEPFWQWRN